METGASSVPPAARRPGDPLHSQHPPPLPRAGTQLPQKIWQQNVQKRQQQLQQLQKQRQFQLQQQQQQQNQHQQKQKQSHEHSRHRHPSHQLLHNHLYRPSHSYTTTSLPPISETSVPVEPPACTIRQSFAIAASSSLPADPAHVFRHLNSESDLEAKDPVSIASATSAAAAAASVAAVVVPTTAAATTIAADALINFFPFDIAVSERQTPTPSASTPRLEDTPQPPSAPSSVPTTARADRPLNPNPPPITSSRGRFPFGECRWTSQTTPAEGLAQTGSAGASPAAGILMQSQSPTPAGTPPISSSSGSLRAAVLKRPRSLMQATGAGSMSSAGQKDNDTVDKSGRPKPWRIEVSPNIPHYVVPPAGRRLGGLGKSGSGIGERAAGRAGSAALPMGGNSGSISRSTSGAVNRIQKSMSSSSSNSANIRYLDFNPWRGRNVEDRLNEATVRNGHYDRVQNTQALQAETSTAWRTWLPSGLRRNNSLATLSQVLALASGLSRERNQIAPASQFKLPPRVTVTDTRRETWLRDLTNKAIPLRKLSRTIPHGLRGKVLLEQCVGKAVPIDRAIWLARCVGAQEMRAFRRKGSVSVVALAEAELRWLKEWTLTTQQFVDSFLADWELAEEKTLPDRRETLQYACRLVRQLYVERLLDQEQFLNWMLLGLRNASRISASTPPTPYFDLWLYIADAYINDILRRRRTGCHLAGSVLLRLEYLLQLQQKRQSQQGYAQQPPVLSLPLAQPMKLLGHILCGHPDTFVCQSLWPRFEPLLASLAETLTLPSFLSTVSSSPTASLASIRRRHAGLHAEMSTEMEQVLQMLLPLDESIRCFSGTIASTSGTTDFGMHFAGLLRMDPADAVPFVIRWCASTHRPGLNKVYVAVRLVAELCRGEPRVVTNHVLAFLSSEWKRSEAGRPVQQEKADQSGRRLSLHHPGQRQLHVMQNKQPEGNKALYQLVGVLTAQGLFLPGNYLASLILQSRLSNPGEIAPDGQPQVRLAAELPVALLDRSIGNLRANSLRRLGYDTDYEAQDLAEILHEVEATVHMHLGVTSATPPIQTSPTLSVSQLAHEIEERSRNVKMAVAEWISSHVVAPMRETTAAASPASSTPWTLEQVDVVRMLIEKTDDLALLAEFLLALTDMEGDEDDGGALMESAQLQLLRKHRAKAGSRMHPCPSNAVLALCADTLSLYLPAFLTLGHARRLYDQIMGHSLAATVCLNVGASSAFQTMLPPGTDVRPLQLALPSLAERMPPPPLRHDAPSAGVVILGVEGQPVRFARGTMAGKNSDPVAGDKEGTHRYQKHYDAGPAIAAELAWRLADLELRLCVATYDENCSPVSEGQTPGQNGGGLGMGTGSVSSHIGGGSTSRPRDAAADEVRDEMLKIATSATGGSSNGNNSSNSSSIDNATMDRLFGTIAMITQEKWRNLAPGSSTGSSVDHLRQSASLFARLRRLNAVHFDNIMVKWLKRLRTLRDRPAVAVMYPVFVVAGCLDLASLLATTADELPREPGGPINSPARNTWRTGYLQEVLAMLSADEQGPEPAKDSSESASLLTCDERQRFRLFLHDAPFCAPAGIAALVRNAVAEMTQWKQQQQQQPGGVGGPSGGGPSGGRHSMAAAASTGGRPLPLPRSGTVDALAVSRLLRTAAMADATAAAHALARTQDPAVRRGLWEMTTLALTRQVVPCRPALDMLRGLDIFAADVGQLALGLAVSASSAAPSSSSLASSTLAPSSTPFPIANSPSSPFPVATSFPTSPALAMSPAASASAMTSTSVSGTCHSSESEGLAVLVLRAVAESQLTSLHVLHSLPAEMAACLKDHAQARLLDLVPSRRQQAQTQQMHMQMETSGKSNFQVACGYLDVVRTIMLSQHLQQQKLCLQRQNRAEAGPGSGTGSGSGSADAASPLFSPASNSNSNASNALPAAPASSPSGLPKLDLAIVDKLGELWCLLQEGARAGLDDKNSSNNNVSTGSNTANSKALRQSILQDWLPTLLSLILLHMPTTAALPTKGSSSRTRGPAAVHLQGSIDAYLAMNKSAVASNTSTAANNNGNSNSLGPSMPRASRDFEQEAVNAGACIALASLSMDMAPQVGPGVVSGLVGMTSAAGVAGMSRGGTGHDSNGADSSGNSGSSGDGNDHHDQSQDHRVLQSRLMDTALLLADGLSDETRQHCVRTLRDLSLGSAGISGVGAGDLPAELAYLLSCPAAGSIHYPRLYLERLASMARPAQQQHQQQQPQQIPQQSGVPGVGALRRMASMGASGPSSSGPSSVPGSAPGSAPGAGPTSGANPPPGERSRWVRFGLKTWDALSDPSPAVQDNDTAVNLWLLDATKMVRQRRR